MMVKKIIVADDHPLFRDALSKCLCQAFTGVQVIQTKDMDSLQKAVQYHDDCDLLLLDLYMPNCLGFSGLLYINGSYSKLPVLIISANEKEDIMLKAIEYGAAGFLPKSASSDQIVEAINYVLSGGIWLPANIRTTNSKASNNESQLVSHAIKKLTNQQFRVAMLLASGLQNKQIAYEMNVTEATIKAHLTSIFRKLGVSSRTLAVLALKRLEIESLE